MALFYNEGDKAIYDSGQYYIPQEKYRLSNYTVPVVEEEEQETSIGIPSTNSFINFANNNDNRVFDANAFKPYKAQRPTDFVTNRTDFRRSGYLPGLEPEETYMDRIGSLIGKGIGMAIPGGNFLLSKAEEMQRQNRLNATDNAFIDMQLGINEQNIHGMGNLANQDRYGYNKVSMFGNYADKVKERVEIAKDFFKKNGYHRPIDQYYLEKEDEFNTAKNQIDFNNFINQRITANNIRKGIKAGTINPTFNIHGDGDNKDDVTPPTIVPTDLNDYQGNDGGSGGYTTGKKQGTTGSWSPGGTYNAPAVDSNQGTTQTGDFSYADYAKGGKVRFKKGGIVSL